MDPLKPNQVSELVVASLDGGRRHVVHRTTTRIEAPNWTPDGRWLIFNAKGQLFRVPADGSQEPTPIVTGGLSDLNNDHVVSPQGDWIFVSSNDGHLYRIPGEGGAAVRLSNTHALDRGFRYFLHGISPDGLTLTYVGLEQSKGHIKTRICTIPASGGEDRFLTDGACPVDGPEFSPDGRWIYFNSEAAGQRPGHMQLFRMDTNGQGREQLTFDDRVNWFPHVSPDGENLVYLSYPKGTLGHPADKDVVIRMLAPDGAGSPTDVDAFNGGQGTINVPSWAPNSQAFAYVRYPISTELT